MCGIAGVLHREGRPLESAMLARMAGVLRHRGPDGEGLHLAAGLPSVGLASRRLAVIDLPGGAQPMSTEDGALTIVYNGELYNTAEVRAELEARGRRFATRCDTEVVLRGYAEWGPSVLERLNGMWAFAVWDAQRRRLFLARDRVGIKPLVYAEQGPWLLFASEIKALLASGLLEAALNPAALPHYLSSFTVPEPLSLLRGVRRLPAGHSLTADAAGVRVEQWWDCALEEEEDRGHQAYVDEVERLLEDAVRRQLVSDVPLGVFLSGGIDSGLVATLAAPAVPELRTFTLGFAGSAADERPAAARLAATLGARHTEETIGARETVRALPALLAAHDEPGQSLVQSHFISRLAAREVKVALAGVGGDELFASYPTHRLVDLLARLDALPGVLRETALAVVSAMPRGARLRRLARLAPDARVSRWLMHQTASPLRASLLHADLRATVDLEAPERHLEAHLQRSRARHPLNRLLYLYLKTYLADELLRALDAMSMAHSLEARVPLLDHRLVELAMRMPARHKMTLAAGKRVLRSVARRRLPPGSLQRGKRGFSLPLEAWLRGELAQPLRDVLSEPVLRRRGVFDASEVRRLLDRYLDGDTRLSQPVLMAFAFELWARQALDGMAAPAPEPVAVAAGAGTDDEGSPRTDLSVIVVNWNTRDMLRECLASLRLHLAATPHEVLVVDNASADGSADMVAAEFPDVRLIRNTDNVGFGRANNQAMRVARGHWLLLLNSDTRLMDASVAALLERVRHEPGLGVAHCRLVFADGRTQHTTYRFPSLRLALLEDLGLYKLVPRGRRGQVLLAGYWQQDQERDVDWVAGAFMLLPRAVFEETGGFCEDFFMYGEDMEWCWRIRRRGYRIRYYPAASVVHLDHGSAEQRWGERRVAICIAREHGIYRSRNGAAAAALFKGVRAAGAALRLGYFGLRAALGGGDQAYYRSQRRYALLCLRAHAGRGPTAT